MAYSLLLLAAIIGGAGFIAYIGDLLGRRMGKARLTIFGLRPRHTAILVTSITGMVIAALTLGILLAANRDYAEVLVKGPRLIAQNRALERANKDLDQDRRRLESRVARAQKEAATAEELVARAREELASARVDLVTAQKELREARAARDQLNRTISGLQDTLREYQNRLIGERQRLAEARAEVREAQEAIRKARQVLEREREFTDYARRQAGITLAGYQDLREKPVVYVPGQEITRGIVQHDPSLSAIREQVYEVLDVASSKAEGQGSVQGTNGRAVFIAPTVFKSLETGKEEQFREEDSVAEITRQIHRFREPVVVQVISLGNSIVGETVPVQVKLFRNRKVLSQGDVLACVNFPSTLSNSTLSAAVRTFLATDVRSAAASSDIIPRLKGNGETTYFELDVDRLAALVTQIRLSGGPVRVCARAAEDVTNAGPLQLEFEVLER